MCKFKAFFFLFFLFVCIENAWAQGTPNVSFGKVERLPLFPSQYVDARNIDVWLPEDYSPKRKYPVIYMHDGQMLFDASNTWNKQSWTIDSTLGQLMKSKKIKRCIVVAIWNNGLQRHAEYWPQKAFELLSEPDRQIILKERKILTATGAIQNVPISDRYLKFIVKELKPYIDRHYATQPGPESTFMAGSSMGGLISLYALCEYPDVFGGAACLSTHWTGIYRLYNNPAPGCIFQYLKMHLPDPATHKIYFDHGDKTLDSFYVTLQPEADSLFRSQGYTARNFLSMAFPGEDHSENAWKKRFSVPMEFLLPNKK